jgi:hypothetical protein
MYVSVYENELLYYLKKSKGHPITGHKGPRGGIEV